MERWLMASLILSTLVACGPGGSGGFHTPVQNVSTSPQQTYVPPTLELKKAGDVEYVEGLRIQNPFLAIDGTTHDVKMTGSLALQPLNGGAIVNLVLDIQGKLGEDFRALLKPVDANTLAQQGVSLGAKLTCVYSDCSDSFIDIYVKYQGAFYHGQVEAQSNQSFAPKKEVKADSSAIAQKVSQEDEEDDELEEDHDHDSHANGYYIGTREQDIKEIFTPVEAKTASTAETSSPKEETSKKESNPQKETAKPETPKRPEAPVAKPPQKRDTSVPMPPSTSATYSSQAQGKPDKGRLFNAVDIYKFSEEKANPGFRILKPENEQYYGTSQMLEMLIQLGKYTFHYLNKYDLVVNTISAKNGGVILGPKGKPLHASHQTGVDVDVEYVLSERKLPKNFNYAVVGGKVQKELMVEDQWKLFKYAVKTDHVDRIFVDPAIKKTFCEFAMKNGELKSDENTSEAYQTLRRLQPAREHANHFHLRVRQDCDPQDSRCFQMVAPANVTNCKS